MSDGGIQQGVICDSARRLTAQYDNKICIKTGSGQICIEVTCTYIYDIWFVSKKY